VSGYLARLVDRGVGVPGGTAGPRLGPVFPLGPGAAAASEPGVSPDLLPSSLPESPPPRAAAPLPSDAAAAATAGRARVEATPVEHPAGRRPARPYAEPPRVRDREPAAAPVSQAGSPPVVATTDRVIRMPEPGVPIPAASRDGGLEASSQSSTRVDAPTAAPADRPTATAVPRPNAARDPLPARADREARAASEHAPQIEVRIGRVEVRSPPEPVPEQWPAAVSQPSPASTGFERLAAARRYVDRRWS
jgi:hypothetical protein